jgi:hypothetical protein
MKTRREIWLIAYSWFSGMVSGAGLLALITVMIQ